EPRADAQRPGREDGQIRRALGGRARAPHQGGVARPQAGEGLRRRGQPRVRDGGGPVHRRHRRAAEGRLMWEAYLALLREPAHLLVELTFFVIIDVLILGVAWPLARR